MMPEDICIAVASGKGGTGKTTVATNVAAVLAQTGKDVVYADCDVEEPNGHLFLPPSPEKRTDVKVGVPIVDKNACTLCGVCAEVCEFNALAVLGGKFIPFPSLCHSCRACIVLCPERALREGMRSIGFIRSGPSRGLYSLGGSLTVGEAQAPPLARAVKKQFPKGKMIIIDAPPGTSCPAVEAVRDAHYVVLVTEPTPFGFNDLRLAMAMLRKLGRPFGVVINRSDIGDSLVEDFCRREAIEILLKLPFDRHIAQSYAAGRLAVDENLEFRENMMKLYRALTQEVSHVRARRSQR